MSTSERLPLLSQHTSALPLTDRRATGVWSFCNEGTRIYLLILISTCFVAASDPPFKASLTRLYKDFLCCQQDPTKCHDRRWCEVESGNATERELSRLFRSQSTFNAGGGAISICVWYWLIWPRIQGRLTPKQRDMTGPLILGQFGVLILETVNTFVAYAAQRNVISTTQFNNLVIFAPAVSFLIGGGPATYWSFRENIVAVAVGQPSSTGRNNHGQAGPPYRLQDRQIAYIILSVFAVGAQVLSGKFTKEFIKSNSSSGIAHLWCLVGGLASFLVGVSILFWLPEIPLPSTDEPLADGGLPSSISPEPDTPSSLYTTVQDMLSSAMTRSFPIVTLVILSGVARSPLTSSVSSNFAVRYISRRLNFDTSDAVFLTNFANIVPLLVVLACRFTSNHNPHHGSNPSSASTQIRVTFSKISWALAFLTTAGIGTGMMAISSSVKVTQTYPFVMIAILLICAGTSYPLFTEPILAGWSAEGKKPSVFVFQQMTNAAFMILGAWLLNWGFQRETDDGQQPHGHIGWTYLVIMVVCVAAGCSLVAAVLLSSDTSSGAMEEEREGDARSTQW